MIMECWAIIVLIFIMAGLIYRSRKNALAIMVLPLAIVPFSHLCSGPIAKMVVQLDAVSNDLFVRICVHVVGLIITCVLVGGLARNIPSPKAQKAFIVTCAIFTFCITAVLIHAIL